jgi:hypothetical protein
MDAQRTNIPPSVQSFRAEYRAEAIKPDYSGRAHLLIVSLGVLSVIAFSLSRLRGVTPAEWLTVPLSFLFANAAEYFGHRGPMHHRRRGLWLIFERHTIKHHHFFTHQAMEIDSPRDYAIVLFPPAMFAFFLGAIATPVGILLFLLFSSNVGWLFVATAMGYFLFYEWLHFSYHQPAESWVRRLPGMERLRHHHLTHHNLALMSKKNFNLTLPLCDLLFGTMHQEE